ncbi:hypothetical protein P3X46_027149 [Hevea brasiliensis]|uniref:FHA domain-containing protein n=1 Tax=Hevea brasiliensis TaxID=3981 RepID=A0ABQ9L026_HEVBR|nr:FHA domain-containing protein DDL isoform X3 [Hevea brasiliensis]KAJ9153739.1 hypothetical protein P3X46_027149 [Hevea brasiliensis]
MRRNSSNHSQSPIRSRGSPHRTSPYQRERSPARHRSSRRDSSPAREKRSSYARSPRHEMSHSPPSQHRRSQRDSSAPAREKNSSRERSCSPSLRTKRLRREQAERETETVVERDLERNHEKGDGTHREKETENFSIREHEKSHGRISDKGDRRERETEKMTERKRERNPGMVSDQNTHRERGEDRESGAERKERRSGRDEIDGKSSRARNGRSTSPSDDHHRSKHRSLSPPQQDVHRRQRDKVTNSRGTERWNDDDDSVAKMKAAEEALESKQKQQPSFELSGKLAAETNRVRGVTLLFNEPPDARKPDIRWRLYVFKNGDVLNEPLYIHRQTCYLFGRERRVADIPTDHPSCSKQHAVIQFRQVEKEQHDGNLSKQVRPYLMDLGSTNKTFINDNPIEPQRYYELFEKDTIKFGNSSREYVLLHENSAS